MQDLSPFEMTNWRQHEFSHSLPLSMTLGVFAV